MKSINLKLLLLACCIMFVQYGFCSNKYTSRVTVKVDPENLEAGSVAVKHAKTTVSGNLSKSYSHEKDGGDPKYPDDYGTEKSDEYETEGGTNRAEHCFYVYAHPAEGYEFDHWYGHTNINNKTDAEYAFTFDNSTEKNATLHYPITAYFRKVGVIKRTTNNHAGYVTLSKDDALTGEEVTATAIMNPIGPGNKNMMSEFSHWEDESGTILSYDNPYTFEAYPVTLKAVFTNKGEVPQQGKYYRVRNAYNRVLTIAGNYKWTPTSSNADVPTSLLRWALPLDYDDTQFNASWPTSDRFEPLCPESSPSTIIYIEEGTPQENGLKNVVLTSQDINTNEITGKTLDIVPDAFENYFGYYGIEATVSGNTAAFKAIPRGEEGIINVTSPAYSSAYCAFAIQPIDEEHIDDFWFGVDADEEMFFEDGYWSTMYTTFPYEIYDDGLEAYYVKAETEEFNGTTYIYLTKIEDGFIPAKSAVLLKCTEHSNSKANRMLPLDPNSSYVKQKNKSLEGNILKGELQLYTNQNRNGRKNFDESSMRILGVNSAGQVGFYKLAGGGELKANKAYLDLSQLGSKAATTSFKLAFKDFTTGLESIEEDGSSILYDANHIYDLSGQRVSNPIPGSIYILNGKKIIWR